MAKQIISVDLEMGALLILGFTEIQYPSMTVIGIIVKNRQYLTQNVVSRSGCLVIEDVTSLCASGERSIQAIQLFVKLSFLFDFIITNLPF